MSGGGGVCGSGSREELLASVKPMKRIDSRGRGELDLQKQMIRKYNRIKSTDESSKIDIMKFLTRRDKQKKDSREEDSPEQAKESAKVQEDEDSDISATYDIMEKSEINCATAAPCSRLEETNDSPDGSTHTNTAKQPSNQEKKLSRFRLKDTFSRFDAKVRRAFSWDSNSPVEPGSSRSGPPSNDLEMAEEAIESPLENVSEYTPADSEEHSRKSERQKSIGSLSEGGSTTVSASEDISEAESLPKMSQNHFAAEENVTSPLLEEHKETSNLSAPKARPTLELFDADGCPIPPPRRNIAIVENNNVSEGSQQESLLFDASKGFKQTPEASSQGTEPKSVTCDVDSPSSNPLASYNAQPSSSGLTSPTSLGAFKAFVNTITKKSSNHGMLYRTLLC